MMLMSTGIERVYQGVPRAPQKETGGEAADRTARRSTRGVAFHRCRRQRVERHSPLAMATAQPGLARAPPVPEVESHLKRRRRSGGGSHSQGQMHSRWRVRVPSRRRRREDGETDPQEMRRASHPQRRRRGVERLLLPFDTATVGRRTRSVSRPTAAGADWRGRATPQASPSRGQLSAARPRSIKR